MLQKIVIVNIKEKKYNVPHKPKLHKRSVTVMKQSKDDRNQKWSYLCRLGKTRKFYKLNNLM